MQAARRKKKNKKTPKPAGAVTASASFLLKTTAKATAYTVPDSGLLVLQKKLRDHIDELELAIEADPRPYGEKYHRLQTLSAAIGTMKILINDINLIIQ